MEMFMALATARNSFGFRESIRQRTDISRVAAATAAYVPDAFGFCDAAKPGERLARDLDGFHLVRELWHAREAMAFGRRAEGGGLRRDGDLHGFAHLAKQRQHAFGFLLAVRADGDGAGIGHRAGAFRRRV